MSKTKKTGKKILIRLGLEFTMEMSEFEALDSKYVIVHASDGRAIANPDLFVHSYENEEGQECDEEGNLI